MLPIKRERQYERKFAPAHMVYPFERTLTKYPEYDGYVAYIDFIELIKQLNRVAKEGILKPDQKVPVVEYDSVTKSILRDPTWSFTDYNLPKHSDNNISDNYLMYMGQPRP